jgi:hypothetical protein
MLFNRVARALGPTPGREIIAMGTLCAISRQFRHFLKPANESAPMIRVNATPG